jgi:hypothetical protein
METGINTHQQLHRSEIQRKQPPPYSHSREAAEQTRKYSKKENRAAFTLHNPVDAAEHDASHGSIQCHPQDPRTHLDSVSLAIITAHEFWGFEDAHETSLILF